MCNSYEIVELLQICLPRHTDTAGYEVLFLAPQIQFDKQLRFSIVLKIWTQLFT